MGRRYFAASGLRERPNRWYGPLIDGGLKTLMEALLFYVLGVITLASALFVVFLRRPLHNVLFMILTMISLAGLFVLLHAEFLAMVQLVVYAGAVMVLFLFVIMLLNLEALPAPNLSGRAARWWIGALLAFVMVVLLGPLLRAVFVAAPKPIAGMTPQMTNTDIIAKELFTTYLLPFEIASVLLLAAIIGAVVLGRKRPAKATKD